MLDDPKQKLLNDLVNNCTREEISWINGYLTGILKVVPDNALLQVTSADATKQPSAKDSPSKLTLAYGTETGNAKKLATRLAASAKKQGVNFRLASLETYRLTELAKEEYFFVIISTQGEGEPPLPAKPFYDHLMQSPGSLSHIKYAVLALGDT